MEKLPLIEMHDFSSEEVQKLLHNKVVVILGDSIQRAIYKDLVRFLQGDEWLTRGELRLRAPDTFWHDHRVEFHHLNRKTNYREVRQYRTDHHLVRAYFITRVYSDYMESILEDFKIGPAPDLLILNSCVWDLNRYLDKESNEPLEKAFREYRENLQILFTKLQDILPESCLVIWNTAMPVAEEVKNAYLDQGMKNETTPRDILRANFEGATLACSYQFDVLDLNFCFRFFEEYREIDGVHWNNRVHRYITKVLMTHVADAWGVALEKKPPQDGIAWNGNADPQPLLRYPPASPPPLPPLFHPSPRAMHENGPRFAQHDPSHEPYFQYDSIPNCGSFSGYWDFENPHELPDRLEERQYGNFPGPADYALNGGQAFSAPFPGDQGPGRGWRSPPPFNVDYMPNGGPWNFPPLPRRRSPRGFRVRQRSDRVMRNQRFRGQHYRPYTHPYHDAGGRPPLPVPPYTGRRGW